MTQKLKVLDLFSGIGGFSLGLERTGGFETVAFCEINPFARRVLAKHWPEVPIYDDVRTLDAARLTADGVACIDVITAGFPCQDTSPAGKRAGIEGDRSRLWRDAIRLADECSARIVLLENNPSLLAGGIGPILWAMAEIRFSAWWDCVQAADVGARHLRERLWFAGFISDAACERFEQCWREQFAQARASRRGLHLRFNEPEPSRVADGIPGRMDRNSALGNAVVPQIPEVIGRAILASRAAP